MFTARATFFSPCLFFYAFRQPQKPPLSFSGYDDVDDNNDITLKWTIYGECDKRMSGRPLNNSCHCVLQEKPPIEQEKNQNEMYLFRKRIACSEHDNKCSLRVAAWICL